MSLSDPVLTATSGEADARDRRVLMLAPTSRDASTTSTLLTSVGISTEICGSVLDLIREVQCGAAAVLVAEDIMSTAHGATFAGVLANQPAWSDLPVLVLAHPGADSRDLGEAVRLLGNVTLLERPLRRATLVSAVTTAMRARERQYQIRGHLAERALAEESLRSADQRKDDFLATLGHELRNPLAPLLTALHLLKLANLQDPVALKVSAVMERQINHLIRLVDDLLELSRITRGVIDVRRELLDLTWALRSAVDMSRPAIESARHELAVTLPVEPMPVSGDAVRLTQVFANLLTNAAKYTNAGGHIWLAAQAVDGHAVVSVRDDGIGIERSQLSNVFDMFTQIDRSNRRTQGGLGIGLTLVRSLVGMHGGRVEARSDGLGAGSEFTVYLPLAAGRFVDPDRSVIPRTFPSRRVLVVDDNHDAGETLGALLTALGAKVRVVDSGNAALEALDEFNPDSVLLDIGMPGMDGYEVSRQIRARTRHRDILLIALSGWGQEHDQRQSRAAGFDHHLVKPPDLDKLRDLLTAGWPAPANKSRV